MLRTVASSCRRLAVSAYKSENVFSCQLSRTLVAIDSHRSGLHTGSHVSVMSKEIYSKRDVVKTAMDSKLSQSLPSDTIDTAGLSEAGVTIPTLETLTMLIDGVPYNELPVAHVKSSPNNTIIQITDHTGTEFIARSSCGQEGFKNVKKSTNVAAQATGLSLGLKVFRMGLRNIRVVVKGLGAGRLASMKGLQMGGLNIVSITDITPVPHGAPRPRKARRL